MTTFFNPPALQDSRISTRNNQGVDPASCLLYWRQRQLVVMRTDTQVTHQQVAHQNVSEQPLRLPIFLDEFSIEECLRRSPVSLVRVDLDLGEAQIRSWIRACEQANKMLYLRTPTAATVPHRRQERSWWLKRSLDWSLALTLLVGLSPVLAAIALLVKVSSPGPVLFSQWRVGKRGRLFRVIKFRTMRADAELDHHQVMAGQAVTHLHKRADDPRITAVGRWLRRSSLDELPQLVNVLRGEMSFVGPRPWALYDAVRIHPDLRSRLNALPGITGAWQVDNRSTLLDINAVNDKDLDYLRNWSIAGDLKILLRTVPKVLSGFGAY